MAAELRRSMGLAHATSLVVGIVVGSSIFVQSSEITRLIQSPGNLILAWAAAGALTLSGALVCAELSAIYPETGGVYVFLRRIFSPALGFLWGWSMFWSVHSGIIAAIAVVMARFAGYFLPVGDVGIRIIAMAAILILSAVNYLGIRAGSTLQLVLTILKVSALALLVAALFIFGGSAHRALPHTEELASAVPWRMFALGIAAGLFSFGGWHMVTYSAGETHSPARTIPLALLIGTLIVTACYISLNAAYLHVMTTDEIARSNRIAADATARVLGIGTGGAIAALVAISALGSLSGIILAGPRVYFAMAQDGLAFRWLGALHPVRQTPRLAIAAQALWSCALVALSSYRQLFTRVVYTEWIFFALLAAGLIALVLRRTIRLQYLRGPLVVLPAVFVVASLSIVWTQLSADPRASAAGLGLLLLGVPVYFLWSRLVPRGEPQNARD